MVLRSRLAIWGIAAAASMSLTVGSLDGAAAQYPKTRVLVTTVEPIHAKHCEGDGEINVLQLQVRFIIANVTDAPVVLYRGAMVADHTMIAKNEGAMRSGAYELDMTPSVDFSSESERRIDPRLFVVIDPHTSFSYVYPGDISVPVKADGAVVSGAIESGPHVLSVSVEPWPDDSKATQWIERMADKGKLFIDTIVTEPMRFEVKMQPNLEKCGLE
jgi:hypothetical protein